MCATPPQTAVLMEGIVATQGHVYHPSGGSPEERLSLVWDKIAAYHSEHPSASRFNRMKLSMFCNTATPDKSFPQLKGRAAEVKALGPALLHVWGELMDQSNVQHKQIRLGLKCSVRMDNIISEHPTDICLPPEAADDFERAAWGFLGCLTALAKHYNALGLKVFDVTVKAHYLAHCALKSRDLSPRLGWCYCGEDFMGKMKKVAQASMRGVKMSKVGHKVLFKYCWGLHFLLDNTGRWWRAT